MVRFNRSRGQSLVEFALFVPVLALILLLAIDLGRAYLGWVTLTNVARIGANYAAVNPDGWSGSGDATIQARYQELMDNDAQGINCDLPASLPAPTFSDASLTIGSRVSVDLTCTFHLLTPFLSSVVGDGAGNIAVGGNASFAVRYGSFDSGTVFTGGGWASPAPTPTPTPSPTPTPLPSGATPAPTATPVNVSFYGTPTSADAAGGGPPGSPGENQIVGVTNLAIDFSNTTSGSTTCLWSFGDGNTSSSCSNSVSHTYGTHGTYNVTLTVNGTALTRSSYVLVACKVPSFSGVRTSNAATLWQAAGFNTANLTYQSGSGNYKIGFQSLSGGLINPAGGCGASILVGP